jgi:hypothetical protein
MRNYVFDGSSPPVPSIPRWTGLSSSVSFRLGSNRDQRFALDGHAGTTSSRTQVRGLSMIPRQPLKAFGKDFDGP